MRMQAIGGRRLWNQWSLAQPEKMAPAMPKAGTATAV